MSKKNGLPQVPCADVVIRIPHPHRRGTSPHPSSGLRGTPDATFQHKAPHRGTGSKIPATLGPRGKALETGYGLPQPAQGTSSP